MANTIPAFVPRYAADFQCIGARCPDTCCAGWSVQLDKSTYKRYKKLILGDSAGAISSKIKPVSPEKRHDGCYGEIVMSAGGSCPFLADDRLCKLQGAFGPSILSPTCSNYPRKIVRLEGMAQKGLTPACPEAARLMFLDKGAMDLRIGAVNSNSLMRDAVVNDQVIDADTAQRVRFTLLDIVRDSSKPLWQRLGAVILISDTLGRLSTSEGFDSFSKLLEAPSTLDSYLTVASRTPAAPAAQADIFRRLFAFGAIWMGGLSAYQMSALKEVIDCFARASQSEDPAEFIAARYRVGIRALNEFLATADYLMTNYAVSVMMDTLFPWEDVSDSYQERCYKLICKIGVVRFILALKAEGRGVDFSKEDFVSVVVAFTRFYEHNSSYKALVDQVFAGLRQSAKASPQAVIGLIRDDF